MIRRRARLLTCLAGLAAVAVVTPPAGAAAFTVGIGHKPSVAVDSAGTAYIAWHWQNSPDTSIKFCRLPRGATACDGGVRTIPGTGASDSIQRSFVTVAGSTVRVVQYRAGPGTGMFRYQSPDGGASWDGGIIVGSVPMEEAVAGPGDTLSGVTQADIEGTVFQSVPLGGGSAGDARADLDVNAEYPYGGTLGFVDFVTPLAVFTNGSHLARFRRYDGSGSLNSAANWTPPVDMGYAAYPQLAGGPTGLILLAESPDKTMGARRWDGTTFGPAVSIAPGDAPNSHLAQDAAGRLHAVFQQGTAAGLHLIHATSDDGVNWQAGALLTSGDGAIADPRVATASDHVGVVVWETRTATGPEIRVSALGPTAPVAPVAPAPTTPVDSRATPNFGFTRGRAKRRGKKFVLSMSGEIAHESADPAACAGKVKITIRRRKKVIARKTVRVSKRCTFRVRLTLKRSKVKKAKRLKTRLEFSGNTALKPLTRNGSIPVGR